MMLVAVDLLKFMGWGGLAIGRVRPPGIRVDLLCETRSGDSQTSRVEYQFGRCFVAALAFAAVLGAGVVWGQDCYTYGGDQQPLLLDTKLMLGGHVHSIDRDENHLVAGTRYLNWCDLDADGVPIHRSIIDCGDVCTVTVIT